MTEKELRKAFYEAIPDITDAHARKVAFYRARDWAMNAGLIEIAGLERHVIVLQGGN
jgi:hypothetical protein